MSQEEPIIIKVTDIFREQYEIPIYQRNYTWKEEINQLLEDIQKNVKKDEDEYYLGNLIVNQKNKEGEYIFEVIDGQQRLTTLFLLSLYLDKALIQKRLKFEARRKYDDTLNTLFEKPQEQAKNGYVEELKEGYGIIENYFKGKNQSEFREKLDKVKLVRVQLPDGTDFNQYFEIMNTRGEQLALHEIAKARILKKLANSEEKKLGAKIWEACEKMDTYIQMNFNPEQRTKIFGNKWDCFKVKNFEDLKEKMLDVQQEEETEKTLKQILEEFGKKEEGYPKENKQDTVEEERERFESILKFPHFLLQVNGVIDETSNLSDEKFIEKIEKNWETTDAAKNFLFELLRCRFFYDNYIVKREKIRDSRDEKRWSLKKLFKNQDKNAEYRNTIALEENHENDRLKTLQACLRITYTSPATMNWITEILRNKRQEELESDSCDLIEVLEEQAREQIRKVDFETTEGFGFERIVFSYLDYILYRDNILEGNENTVKYPCLIKMKDWQFRFRNSIEHFYPQKSREQNEDWKEELNAFGNLALITAPANAEFSNFPPDYKVRLHPETVEQSLKLMIMEDEMKKNNNIWTTDLVRKHGKEMINILKEECEKH